MARITPTLSRRLLFQLAAFSVLSLLALVGVRQSLALPHATTSAPAAAFACKPVYPVVAQPVAFVDQSTGRPTAWSWSFGDGTTSTAQNPTHTYSKAGSYTVTLKSSNVAGSTTATHVVAVVAAPVASFTYSATTPDTAHPFSFTDTSQNSPTSWLWSFGDGTTSTTRNPTHTYSKAGSYTVTLKATNSAGSSTASRIVTVTSLSSGSAFTYSPATPMSAHSIAFSDKSTSKPAAWLWSFGDGATSKLQNPAHIYNAPGSYTVTLQVSGGSGSSKTTAIVKVIPEVSATGYDMTLTLSDQAQSTTAAFDGLAIITGNLDAQSFFPPGKVADYTGFQYLRDNDPDNMGHDTDFLTRVANNVLYILTDSQMAQLKALAVTQLPQVNLYAYQRFTLMDAFRRALTGDIPSGSSGLNLDSVAGASRALYLIDGQVSFDRALLYANIYKGMNSTQLACLNAMKGKGFNEWPNITDAQVASKMSNLAQGTATLVMTYASDIFTWYAGTVYSDVYFCPERHGTYYGGFYIKDAPAVGVSGYNISEALTNTAGTALLDSSKGYVTSSQAALMATLVDLQRNNLYAGDTNIVATRTQIATLLRTLTSSSVSSDQVKAQVLALSDTYGELDGEDNYAYATVFANLNRSLTPAQQTKLQTLRTELLSGTYANGKNFDFSVATTPYLYSDPITDQSVLTPYLNESDGLFFPPATN